MIFRKSKLKSKLRRFSRYRHIAAVLTKYGFEEAVAVVRGKFRTDKVEAQLDNISKKHTRAVRARLALEELGPTFIKLGQLLSTRPDLIPADYITELESLQDQVAAVKSQSIISEIERQLGKTIDEAYESFEREPIAAGSIAQVHKAVTREGKAAAVKVRRPGIVEMITTECEMLHDFAGLLKISLFKDDEIDPQRMVKEFNEAVSVEVNLDNERRNQLRFLQNFADDPTIHVPEVYADYCSEGVLTMEYIDGIKPNDRCEIQKQGLDPRVIAKRGARFVLRQIFDFGFFHSDPHPGNFLLLPDNVLVPLDFGQVSHLSVGDRKFLNEFVAAIVDKEASGLAEALEQADMVHEETDLNQFTRDAEHMLSFYHNLPLREIPIAKVIGETFDLIRKHHIKPPPQFTLMLKSLATIESFALSLDPDFQIIDHLKPYAHQFGTSDINPKQILKNARKTLLGTGNLASQLPGDINSIIKKFRHGKFQMRVHHEHLENLTKTIGKSSNRISFALIIAALLIASSMLIPQDGNVAGLFTLQTLGILGYVIAAIIGLWLIISIISSKDF